ncbi:MAG TPA: xanthine dehydrogenase family protein subunit M [Actinomycetota bacterium]|jgi:carbon-monoxide dehydrogenase medium subunit|nr:xanthine dehydrogenase family protein subunit M [Actinomycetota bacterium]
MLPSSFEYHRADTLDEALSLLEQHGDDAKVLAGGQSLIPMMKLRFASPGHLVDINRIAGLDGIAERDGELRLGTLVRHKALAASDIVRNGYPAIADTAPQIADPIVRNLGSIGGSLSHADPAGDLASTMLAMGASVVLTSTRGERVVPIGEFLVDTFTTSAEPDELVTEIRVPTPPPRSGGTYLKLERKVGDWATVGVAVALTMSNGSIGRAGIGLTGVGLKNLQATDAEQSLAGAEPTDEAFAEAGRKAAAVASPVSDVRGPEEYKRHMIEVYVRRGLAQARDDATAA